MAHVSMYEDNKQMYDGTGPGLLFLGAFKTGIGALAGGTISLARGWMSAEPYSPHVDTPPAIVDSGELPFPMEIGGRNDGSSRRSTAAYASNVSPLDLERDYASAARADKALQQQEELRFERAEMEQAMQFRRKDHEHSEESSSGQRNGRRKKGTSKSLLADALRDDARRGEGIKSDEEKPTQPKPGRARKSTSTGMESFNLIRFTRCIMNMISECRFSHDF